MIVDLTHNHGEVRKKVILSFFDNPSAYMQEDIADAKREYGWSRYDCMGLFYLAPRLAYVEIDGVPIIALGINQQGIYSSMSHADIAKHKWTVAKEIRRWIKTPMGKRFFKGSCGYVWKSDCERYSFMESFIRIVGYKFRREIEHLGEPYLFYEWEPD